MKRFAVIGLGHFGGSVARLLFEKGEEVIAVDFDKDAVQDAAEFSNQAILADATEKKTLEELGLSDVDVAIVSLGDRMDIITLVALHVIELRVPHVVVKALSLDHAKILRAIGVNEIIHPEEEAAARIATRLSLSNATDYIPLLGGYSIIEMEGRGKMIGKRVKDIESLKVQVVAVQQAANKKVTLSPEDNYVFAANDLIVVLGENEKLREISTEYC